MMHFKGSQFERDIMLWAVRWYVAYPISYRQLEEMMGERGVAVDHSTLNRWVIKYAPELEKVFRRRQCSVGRSWRMDAVIPGRARTGGRATPRKGRDVPRAGERTQFREWKTKTKRESDLRHWFGATDRRATAQTGERRCTRGKEHNE